MATASGDTVKEGYLTKRGGFVKNWKARYFVLQGATLIYRKSPTDADILGSIPLHDAQVCVFRPEVYDRYYCFGLTPAPIEGSRTFVLTASSQEDMNGWIQALCESGAVLVEGMLRSPSILTITTSDSNSNMAIPKTSVDDNESDDWKLDSNSTKEGYLLKRGAIVKSWKIRYFVLSGYALKYFLEKRMGALPLGTINLIDSKLVHEADETFQKHFTFSILPIDKDRKYVIVAPNEADFVEWVHAISCHIEDTQVAHPSFANAFTEDNQPKSSISDTDAKDSKQKPPAASTGSALYEENSQIASRGRTESVFGLRTRMLTALGGDQQKFLEFKKYSIDLLNDKISCSDYVKVFFKTFRKRDALSIFPDLIAAVPNKDKRTELRKLFEEVIKCMKQMKSSRSSRAVRGSMLGSSNSQAQGTSLDPANASASFLDVQLQAIDDYSESEDWSDEEKEHNLQIAPLGAPAVLDGKQSPPEQQSKSAQETPQPQKTQEAQQPQETPEEKATRVVSQWVSQHSGLIQPLLTSLHNILPDFVKPQEFYADDETPLHVIRQLYHSAILQIHPELICTNLTGPDAEYLKLLTGKVTNALRDSYESYIHQFN